MAQRGDFYRSLSLALSLFICRTHLPPAMDRASLSAVLCVRLRSALPFPRRQILIEPMLTMFADILYLMHHLLGKLFYKQIIATAAAATTATAVEQQPCKRARVPLDSNSIVLLLVLHNVCLVFYSLSFLSFFRSAIHLFLLLFYLQGFKWFYGHNVNYTENLINANVKNLQNNTISSV